MTLVLKRPDYPPPEPALSPPVPPLPTPTVPPCDPTLPTKSLYVKPDSNLILAVAPAPLPPFLPPPAPYRVIPAVKVLRAVIQIQKICYHWIMKIKIFI